MSERVVQTVTPRQLRREFNGIGLTFLVVFALAAGVIFGYQWLTPILEPYYQTVDRQAAEMGIRIVVTLVVMLLPFQVYAALKKIKTGRFFGACQGEWREILELILIGLALNLLLTFIVGILALVLSWSNIQFASSEMIVQGKLPAVILSVVQAVLIFPLCEEFIFRGVCLRSFGRMGNYFAIFASSLLFSLMHGNLFPGRFSGGRHNALQFDPAGADHPHCDQPADGGFAVRAGSVFLDYRLKLHPYLRVGVSRADSQSASADHHPPGGESLGFDPAVLSVLGNGDHADFVRCFERIND